MLKNTVLYFEQRYDKYVFYELSIIKWCCVISLLWVLFREKFLRLTMGFRYFMYSHSLVPVIDLWFRVVTKLVSEQWFHCWSLNCRFVFFLHYCGIRLSNVGSVIIVSSILCCVCFKLRKKILRLNMGFGYFMYSHSLVPIIDLWVRGVTKLVSEQWFHCWSLNCHFVFFLYYCGD